MYIFLDKFFFIFHTSLILFDFFGWIWKKTRLVNLVILLLTVFSWFILGIWYGFGYCPSTQWHWHVRMKLGHFDMGPSYIKFLIDSLTGMNLDKKMVDIFSLLFLLLALSASALTNGIALRKKHQWTKTEVWMFILTFHKLKLYSLSIALLGCKTWKYQYSVPDLQGVRQHII